MMFFFRSELGPKETIETIEFNNGSLK